MMMLMVATFIARGSINLNALCTEGGGGGGGGGVGGNNGIIIIKRKRKMVQSHLQNRWVFRHLRTLPRSTN